MTIASRVELFLVHRGHRGEHGRSSSHPSLSLCTGHHAERRSGRFHVVVIRHTKHRRNMAQEQAAFAIPSDP